MYIPVWAVVAIALVAWTFYWSRTTLGKLREEINELRKGVRARSKETEALQLAVEDVHTEIVGLKNREEVTAERFVVVDTNGKPRGFFGMENGASPSLLFMEEDGAIPSYLRHSPDGWAVLRLGNRGGEEIMATIDTRIDSRTDVGKGPFAFVSVTDRDGFNTTIGRVHEIERVDATAWNRLAAAALVMTKDREVIWSAP